MQCLRREVRLDLLHVEHHSERLLQEAVDRRAAAAIGLKAWHVSQRGQCVAFDKTIFAVPFAKVHSVPRDHNHMPLLLSSILHLKAFESWQTGRIGGDLGGQDPLQFDGTSGRRG